VRGARTEKTRERSQSIGRGLEESKKRRIREVFEERERERERERIDKGFIFIGVRP
jgi:hypothetical protein